LVNSSIAAHTEPASPGFAGQPFQPDESFAGLIVDVVADDHRDLEGGL
jgi:hypothetical protein